MGLWKKVDFWIILIMVPKWWKLLFFISECYVWDMILNIPFFAYQVKPIYFLENQKSGLKVRFNNRFFYTKFLKKFDKFLKNWTNLIFANCLYLLLIKINNKCQESSPCQIYPLSVNKTESDHCVNVVLLWPFIFGNNKIL